MLAEGGNTGYLRARMLCENEGSMALRGAPAGVSTQTLSRQLWKAMASGPSVATQNKPRPLPTCLVSDAEPGGGRARERVLDAAPGRGSLVGSHLHPAWLVH